MFRKTRFVSTRIILFIVYIFVFIFFGGIAFVHLSNMISGYLYKYNFIPYKNELDSLFNPQILNHVKVLSVYNSVESGTIYYVNIKNSNLIILQPVNFEDINFEFIELNKIDKIKNSQLKSYYTILNPKFPILQQALNPRKSSFLRILIENNFEIKENISNDKFYYLIGNFSRIVFGNSQNCSIVSFLERENNEILVLKFSNKLYFLMKSSSDDFLKIINLKIL